MTEIEKYNLRLRCMEIALIGCRNADVSRLEALPFAEKIWEWMLETPRKDKKALSST